jgi:hypothetical protein
MRPVPILLALFALLGVAVPAAAQEKKDTLTVTTSLGPIAEDDTRNLRARGKAPKGSKVTVRFYRGDRKLGSMRAKVRDGRYKAWTKIDRLGQYRVKVTAKTRRGSTITVTARLKYGPKAEADPPSEGEDE